MKLLLDTHVFLWSKTNDPRMSQQAWTLLRDPGNELFLSSISVAEIAIKHSVGKLQIDIPLNQFINSGMRDAGIQEIPLSIAHVLRLPPLPLHHGDSFDRLLIATALEENLTLVTDDSLIRKYRVTVAW